jgi:phenylpropionate dioxygenase-like ring-hydroxylating dioxygenase large terminal subunit
MFLRNGWYSAIWSHELEGKPVGKTFLNEKVVLFRNDRGRVGALEDCCCHRAAPLSRGEIRGAYLACGYHGLKFDVNGQCVEVPGQSEIPPGAKVRSYPVHEKNNVVWIWMGDAAKADTAKIPDMPWLSDPKWATTPGNIYVKTNYQFIIDNLLDLTHVTYVHKNTLAGDPREATTPTKTERLNDGVRVGRWMLDFVPPPLFAKAGNFTSNVDRWQHVTWHPPGIVYLDVGCAKAGTGAPQGDRSQGVTGRVLNTITPETAHTCMYFWTLLRNYRLRDQTLTTQLREANARIFEEDRAVVEAQQRAIAAAPEQPLNNLNVDAGALWARRIIERLSAEG